MIARLRTLAGAIARLFSTERPAVSFAERLDGALERAEPALRVSAWERNLVRTSSRVDGASERFRNGS